MTPASPPPILVTGGTGTLGRQVVARLRNRGHTVRILSRHPSDDPDVVVGDLETGSGVAEAVAGIHTVVHAAGSAKRDGEKARSLVEAAVPAGVRHLVYISVVGAERVPVTSAIDRAAFGYFERKLQAEELISGSGIPWTTLRASQFHELVLLTVTQLARLPIVPVPAGQFQPIDSGEVADRLVELTLAEPAGLVPDVAGPRVYELRDLVRSYLRATGKRRIVAPVRAPGGAARAVEAGATLNRDRAVGVRSWEDFLAEQVAREAE